MTERPHNVASMPINEDQYWVAIATVIEMQRVGRGLTQAQLAEKVGIGREALNAYLKGKRKMPFPTYLRIADALGLTPAGLAELAETRLSSGQ